MLKKANKCKYLCLEMGYLRIMERLQERTSEIL
jgi:hypothetical protein